MLLSSNSTCFVSGFVIFRCFCLRCSIYFVVAVDDNVIVCIVVLVITLVLATSLAVVHINVKLQPLLHLFFSITRSHQTTAVQNLFFTECSSNIFRFVVDVSLTAKLKWVPWSNLVSNHNVADYSALKYLPTSGCSTSSSSETPPLLGKGNVIYDSSQVRRWIQVTLLWKAVPLQVDISTAWHYITTMEGLRGMVAYDYSMAIPPTYTRGNNSITPPSGISLKTDFSLSCSNWESDKTPPYQFQYRLENGLYSVLYRGVNNNISTSLIPPRINANNFVVKFIATVTDNFGPSASPVSLTVQVVR